MKKSREEHLLDALTERLDTLAGSIGDPDAQDQVALIHDALSYIRELLMSAQEGK